MTEPDPYALRNAVGKWLRLKAEQPHAVGQKTATDMLVSQGAAAMYRQLAADAEHSDLLARLFKGGDPS